MYVVPQPKLLFRQIHQRLKGRHLVRGGNGENAIETKLVGSKGTDAVSGLNTLLCRNEP